MRSAMLAAWHASHRFVWSVVDHGAQLPIGSQVIRYLSRHPTVLRCVAAGSRQQKELESRDGPAQPAAMDRVQRVPACPMRKVHAHMRKVAS